MAMRKRKGEEFWVFFLIPICQAIPVAPATMVMVTTATARLA